VAAKVGTVTILYRASTISLQAVVHPEHTLGALNMKEEEEVLVLHLYIVTKTHITYPVKAL